MIWHVSNRADPKARELADRHYNRQKVGAPLTGEQRKYCLGCRSQVRNETARRWNAQNREKVKNVPANCRKCGKEYIRLQPSYTLCPDCKREERMHVCVKCGNKFLPDAPNQKTCADCKLKLATSSAPRRRKLSLSEAAKIARSHGLSYGEAVAMGLLR